MWNWAWGSGSGGGSASNGAAGANSPTSADEEPNVDVLAAGVDGVDLANGDAPSVADVDGSGAVYADLARSLRSSRRGVLPHIVPKVWGGWTEDDLSSIQLRGASYAQDRVKVDCGPPLYRLMHVDTFYTDRDEEKVLKVSQRDDCWVNIMHAKRAVKLAEGYKPTMKCRVCDPIPSWHDHPLSTTIVIDIVFPIKNINMYCVQYYERRVPPADVLREMLRIKEEEKEKAAAAAAAGASGAHKKKHKKKHHKKKGAADHDHEHEHDHEHDEHEHGEHDEHDHDEHDHEHERTASSSPSSSNYRFCCDGLEEIDIERVEAFDRLLERFLNGSDEYRDSTFKIIPRVAEGSWIVKKGVGRVPAILGRKVAQSYVRDVEKNVIEIDDDLANSRIAGQIVGLVKSYCKSIIVDMSFLFEGADEGVLPESLIGGLRYSRADMDKVQHFEDNARSNVYPDL